MSRGHLNAILGLAFAGAIALFGQPSLAQEWGTALTTTTQEIQDHDLNGVLTVLSDQNAEVVGITFTSSTSGQVIAFPKASIDAVNKAISENQGPVTIGQIVTVTWVQNFPGGGSLYSASVGGRMMGFVIVQPNGNVSYVAL